MKTLLTIVAVAMSFSSAATANLITNGDFELNVIGGSQQRLGTGDGTSLPGWVVTGASCASNCINVVNTNYTESSVIGPLFFEAESGNQSIDITGQTNTLDGGVRQTVATTAGTFYELSFYIGHMDGTDPGYSGPSIVDLFINGVTQGAFSNNLNTPNQLNWALQTFTFQATSNATIIAFVNGTPATNGEAALDNVQLNETSATPEPGTTALLGVIVVCVGLSKGRLQFRAMTSRERGSTQS